MEGADKSTELWRHPCFGGVTLPIFTVEMLWNGNLNSKLDTYFQYYIFNTIFSFYKYYSLFFFFIPRRDQIKKSHRKDPEAEAERNDVQTNFSIKCDWHLLRCWHRSTSVAV